MMLKRCCKHQNVQMRDFGRIRIQSIKLGFLTIGAVDNTKSVMNSMLLGSYRESK